MLKELCVDGYLVSDGIGRGTTYQLNRQQNLTSSDANLTSSDANLTSSGANLTSSGANVATSDPNVATSISNMGTSDSNVETSNHIKNTKKKCSQKELFDMIVECTDDWKSIEDISRDVQRTTKYLNNSVIKKMVSEGLLVRKFPMPNHPAQKYRRADKSNDE